MRAWSKDNSTEDAKALESAGRPVLSSNHIKPAVDVLVGTEQQNRADPKAEPQGDEDEDDARAMSQLMKFVSDQVEMNETLSEGFKDAIVRMMACYGIEIDYSSDPVNGEIIFEKLIPGKDIRWDRKARRYDRQDARYFLRPKMAWIEDVVAQYPEHAAVLRQALGLAEDEGRSESTDGARADAYGSTGHHPDDVVPHIDAQFYDPAMRRILVLEAWYREYEPQHMVVDKTTGTIEKMPDAASARAMAKSDAKNLTYSRRLVRRIKLATVLPATLQVLEDGDSPYENDPEKYPFVPFIPDAIGDEVTSLVSQLKDSQRVENKRWSQLVELASTLVNIRPMYETGAVVNPDVLKNPADRSAVEVKPGHWGKVGFLYPSEVGEAVRLLYEAKTMAKSDMRDTGPNTDLLGIKSESSSGIAIARRQAQGQTQVTPYFTAFRRTRKLCYERLARRIQQHFTLEKTLRLRNEIGKSVLVRINPMEFRREDYDKDALRQARVAARQANGPLILRDVEALKYDIVISDGPITPTARAAMAEQLLAVAEKFPEAKMILLDVIFRMIPDLPDRPLLVERATRLRAMQGVIPPEEAGLPPVAAPAPGMPPVQQPGAEMGAVPGGTVAPMPQAPPIAPPPAAGAPGAPFPMAA